MAAYSTGTIDVKCGTKIIVGNGTAFLANVAVNATLYIKWHKTIFTVQSVDSNTQITLRETLPGPVGNTVHGVTYEIGTDQFTPTIRLPMIGRHMVNSHELVTRNWRAIDNEMPKPS